VYNWECGVDTWENTVDKINCTNKYGKKVNNWEYGVYKINGPIKS
jgi:hypothetical protein